jgi:hypothetical protein
MEGVLRALTSDGYAQPGVGMMVNTNTKGPVSLSAMQAREMLDDTPQALTQFHGQIGNRNRNDRNAGAFPSNFSVTDQREIVLRALAFVRKYDELMVEKGLLAP